MQIDIPSMPVVDQLWLAPGNVYYRWTGTAWELVDPLSATPISRVPTCTIAPTPPTNAFPADFWYSTTNGFLFIYYDDGNTIQWVVTNPGRGGAVIPPGVESGSVVYIDDFPPINPSPGRLWWSNELGVLFVYYDDGNTAQWVATGGGGAGGASSVYVGDTPPASVLPKTLWWNSAQGTLYIYYDDGNTTQWVPASPTSSSVAVRGSANVMDFIPNELWPAIADGTSTTDVYAYLQAAIDSGAGEVHFPAGTYRIVGNVALAHPGNQHWRGAGMGRTIIEKDLGGASGGFGCVRTMGSCNTTQGNTLAANVFFGATVITLSAGKGANFAAGDIVIIGDESDNFPGVTDSSKRGEFVTIRQVTGDVIDVLAPLQYTYQTTATAQMMKVTWKRGVAISDMSFTNTVQTDPNGCLVYLGLCMEPRIMNCSAYWGASQGFAFAGCYQARATVEVYDLLSNDDPPFYYFGYGVLETGINLGNQFNITAARVRHAYTTGGTGTSPPGPAGSVPRVSGMPWGMPTSTLITGTSTNSYTTSWDTHLDGWGITFSNCVASGSGHPGIQFRSLSSAAIGCHITKTTGAGICISNVPPLGGAQDTLISGCTFDRTNCGINTFEDAGTDWRELGAIEDRGTRTTVMNCSITNSGGAGINVHSAAQDPIYRGIRIVNPCRLSTTMKDGISALATTTTSLRISDVDIRCADTRMNYGVRATSANLDAMVTGVRVTNAQIAPVDTHVAHKVWGGTANGPVSFGPNATVAIVGGVLDITNITTGVISVNGEGGLADDLVTITSATDTASIMLRQGTGTITVKSTGNITSPSGADVFLGTSRFLMLTRIVGGTWLMTSLA